MGFETVPLVAPGDRGNVPVYHGLDVQQDGSDGIAIIDEKTEYTMFRILSIVVLLTGFVFPFIWLLGLL